MKQLKCMLPSKYKFYIEWKTSQNSARCLILPFMIFLQLMIIHVYIFKNFTELYSLTFNG